MSKTFTYTFNVNGFSGTISALTGDTPQTVTIDSNSYQGYVVTGISGSFNGQTITGLIGPGGTHRIDAGNAEDYDNTIFTSSTQGANGSSFNGIDVYGLGFVTSTGSHYAVFSDSPSNYSYDTGGNVTSISPPYSSNYASVVCFATGTLIRTVSGDVAVEALQVGDLVLTRDGRRKPIRWIGHRHVACDKHPEPAKVHPVRVRAGSFGEGLPTADLWLSRNHALCLDNSLVPVRGLIDGDRIAQVPVETVTYWHVELDGHDVILANGMPAESYLDTGNRAGFANAPASLLHFDEEPSPGYDGSGFCLPMIESGPRLSAIRARYGLGRTAAAAPAQAACAVHLVADEAVIAPCLSGENELRFLVPAGASELRLVSPSHPAGGADIRLLGVIVGGVAVSDGAGWREIALDDAGLYAGFHAIEREAGKAWRWTDGEAHLSPGLWAGLTGPVLLRITGQFAGLGPVDAEEEERAAA